MVALDRLVMIALSAESAGQMPVTAPDELVVVHRPSLADARVGRASPLHRRGRRRCFEHVDTEVALGSNEATT